MVDSFINKSLNCLIDVYNNFTALYKSHKNVSETAIVCFILTTVQHYYMKAIKM